MPMFLCGNGRCSKFRRPQTFGLSEAELRGAIVHSIECPECGDLLFWTARAAEFGEEPHPEETAGDLPAGHFYDLLRTDPAAAVAEVTARRELHWVCHHPGRDPDRDVPECPVCPILDGQLARAIRLERERVR